MTTYQDPTDGSPTRDWLDAAPFRRDQPMTTDLLGRDDINEQFVNEETQQLIRLENSTTRLEIAYFAVAFVLANVAVHIQSNLQSSSDGLRLVTFLYSIVLILSALVIVVYGYWHYESEKTMKRPHMSTRRSMQILGCISIVVIVFTLTIAIWHYAEG